MSRTVPSTCTACGHPVQSARKPPRPGVRSHQGRGLCSTCYPRARRDDTLIDHERLSYTAEELLEWLRGMGLDETRPIRAQLQELAPRAGTKYETLSRAYYRARGLQSSST